MVRGRDIVQRLLPTHDRCGYRSHLHRFLSARKQNQALLQIKSLLLEKKSLVNGVFIRFVFKGDPKDAENSSVLPKLQEDLESKKYLIDQFFGREVNLVIDYRLRAANRRRCRADENAQLPY